jgi:hypothetical protein
MGGISYSVWDPARSFCIKGNKISDFLNVTKKGEGSAITMQGNYNLDI